MAAAARADARVLVVDDEEQIRRLVRILLTRLQDRYTLAIHEAGSYEQALPQMERQTFHLVITDYNMPGKTGVDLLSHAYRRSPNTGRMLITALAQMDIGVDAVNRGHVDAFMRKPWDNTAFLTLVDSLLEGRATATPAPGTATRAPPAPATSAATRAEEELRDIERRMAQLRVRLGLGTISAEGYQQLHKELAKRRAELQVQLLR